jgi:hypothetical protein
MKFDAESNSIPCSQRDVHLLAQKEDDANDG